MSKSDNLMQIIQLLTASEKKYFKQYISACKDSKFYATLFDQLQKMKEYDVTLLSKKLKKTPKQVSDSKDYLVQVLLKALENFHTESIPLIKVNLLINQAEIARMKGIPALTFEILDKAEAICEQYDYFLPLISIYKRRQSGYAVQYNFGSSLNTSGKIEEYLTKESNLAAYRDLHKKINYLVLPRRDKSVDLSIEDIHGHPLLQDPSAALSLTAKTFYYRSAIIYNNWFADKKKALQLAKDLYNLVMTNREKLEGNDYVRGGCLIDCIPGLNIDPTDHKEFSEVMAELEILAAKVRSYDRNFYYELRGGIDHYQQSANTAMGFFADGVKYYYKMNASKAEQDNISPIARAMTLFASALCFYFEGQPEMATKLIHEREDMKVKVLSVGRTFVLLRVLLAMIAFDDGNKTTMDSQFIAAKRHAKETAFRANGLNLMHKIMTRLLQSDVSSSEVESMIEKIGTYKNTPRESIITVFHFDIWVRSRARK